MSTIDSTTVMFSEDAQREFNSEIDRAYKEMDEAYDEAEAALEASILSTVVTVVAAVGAFKLIQYVIERD